MSDEPVQVYRWQDGTDVSGSWVPYGAITPPYENGLISDKRVQWVDEYTGNKHHYICEKGNCSCNGRYFPYVTILSYWNT